MATNGAPRSSSAGGTKSRLSQLRTHYRSATSAFLVRDYSQTAISLEEARLLLPPAGKEDAWLNAMVEGREEPELDMERKLAILRITFLATVASSAPSPSSLEAYPAAISKLLSLPSAALIPTLWHSLLPSAEASPADLGTGLDVFPTPSAAFLHPSLIVALSLGALKMEQPAQARAVLEAWFGSVGESVERVAWEESELGDWSGEFSLSGGGDGMSSSGILSGPPPTGTKPDPRKALLASWIKAMDLLVLHVMPRLGEWEAAGDFVRMQGIENGGWVPDARVEVSPCRPQASPHPRRANIRSLCFIGRPRSAHPSATARSPRPRFAPRAPTPAKGAASTSRFSRQVSILAPRWQGKVAGHFLPSTRQPVQQKASFIFRHLVQLVFWKAFPSRLAIKVGAELSRHLPRRSNNRLRLSPNIPHLIPFPLLPFACHPLPQRLNLCASLLCPLSPSCRLDAFAEHRE